MTQLVIWTLLTTSQSLVMVLKMVSNIGLLETLGDPTGVKVVYSESSEVLTTLTLNPIVLGPLQEIHGHHHGFITPLMKRKKIPTMTLQMDFNQINQIKRS